MRYTIQKETIFTTEPRGYAVAQPFGGSAAFYNTIKVGRGAAVQSRGLRPVFAG